MLAGMKAKPRRTTEGRGNTNSAIWRSFILIILKFLNLALQMGQEPVIFSGYLG
jgi:hypothetical protein